MPVVSEHSKSRTFSYVAILCLLQLYYYMYRFSLSSSIIEFQAFFDINDLKAGSVISTFNTCLTLACPLYGYIGDRWSRNWIITVSAMVHAVASIGASFIPHNAFIAFAIVHGLIGAMTSSCYTIIPTLFADCFTDTARSTVYMIFYLCIPFGSGAGYVVGPYVASALGEWQYGLRWTPVLGFFVIVVMTVVGFEPRKKKLAASTKEMANLKLSYGGTIRELLQSTTWMLCVIGTMSMTMVSDAATWWTPIILKHSTAHHMHLNRTEFLPDPIKNEISFTVGVAVIVAGIVGVIVGALLAHSLKKGILCFKFCQTTRADPIVCSLGAGLSLVMLLATLTLALPHPKLTVIAICFAITGVAFQYAVAVNMIMGIVPHHIRCTAYSIQSFIENGGGALVPTIVGSISDLIRGSDHSPFNCAISLIRAMLLPVAICVVCVSVFVASIFTLPTARKKFEEEMALLSYWESTNATTSRRVDQSPDVYSTRREERSSLIPSPIPSEKRFSARSLGESSTTSSK